MFGTYRYALACLVVLTHLAGIRASGSYAVFGFYTLSGYLMALVLNQRYGFSISGRLRFLANRALRLYPPYLVILGLAAALVAAAPRFAHDFHPALVLPVGSAQVLHNLLIFGTGWNAPSRLIPPTWSLYAEWTYYLAMALVLARSRAISLAWLVISVAYTAHLLYTGAPWAERYYPIAAASLPFSIGSSIYFFRARLSFMRPRLVFLLGPIFLVNALFAPSLWHDSYRSEGFYASLLLVVLLLLSLMGANKLQVPVWLRRADKLLGDLSYPVFLCQYHASLAVALLISHGGEFHRSIPWFFLSFILTNALAYLVHRTVESPVNRVRDHLRGGAFSSPVEPHVPLQPLFGTVRSESPERNPASSDAPLRTSAESTGVDPSS